MELSAGDEVLTGSGIFGRVLDVEPDRVTIETAPGTRITVVRSTIARRLTEPAPDESSWHDEEREGVAPHELSHEERLGHEDSGPTSPGPDPEEHDPEEHDPEDEVTDTATAHDAVEPDANDDTGQTDPAPEGDKQ